MPTKSKSQIEAEKLVAMLPEDVKQLIVAFAGATMDAWEQMDEDDRADYDNDPCKYLGVQMFLGAKIILEQED